MKIMSYFKFVFVVTVFLFSPKPVFAGVTATGTASSSEGVQQQIDNALTPEEWQDLYGNIENTSAEKIISFISDIEVHKDSSVHITETIEYDFGANQKHGMYRDIPLTNGAGTFDTLKISNIKVTDESGTPYNFDVINKGGFLSDGGISIKIGDAYTTVTGKHTYAISYDLKNALGYFDDRAEIYWNVTGNEWQIPIEHAEAHVYLLGDVRNSIIKLVSFCGWVGSKDSCDSGKGSDPVYHPDTDVTEIIFYGPENKSFNQGEGMTIAAAFSKSLVAYPTKIDFIKRFLKKYLVLLVPIFVAPLLVKKQAKAFWVRNRFYRNNPIVVEFDSDGVDPLQTANIIHGKTDNADFSAQIIYLAIQGYLKIKKSEGIYSFIGTNKDTKDLTTYNKNIVRDISDKNETDLKDTFYETVFMTSDLVDRYLTDLELLSGSNKEPNKFTQVRNMSNFSAKVFLGFFLAINPGIFIWLLAGPQIGFAFSATLVLMAILTLFLGSFSHNTNLSLKGLELERKLLGLRLYIDMAEEERIKFHNAPEKTTEHFEKLLPFAMVFDLEKKWAEEFKDIYSVPPQWYEDSFSSGFTAGILVDRMQSFSSTAASSIFSPAIVYSTSSGSSGSSFDSSGFSSGSSSGSSGGGGGGGGGGSW